MNHRKPLAGFPGRAALYALAILFCNPAFFSSSSLADDYTQTHYPIVLIHGMAGFDDILGINYWYRIPAQLRAGGAEVYQVQVSALNQTEIRGEQAARQIEAILAASGAEKVNLIGHSHGGPTSRYVASVYPQYVASVTSVGGVNWGTPVADATYRVGKTSTFLYALMFGPTRALGNLLDFLSGGNLPQSAEAGVFSLTTAETERFNADYPEGMPTEYCGEGEELADNGVRYFSWTGNRPITHLADIGDYFLFASGQLIGEPNDGLVPACSTHLGTVLRDTYRMNHLDEVDQLFGLHSHRDTDPVTVYRQQANRLKLLGL
ncbi:MAG TPA: triacylglycerol lipase [Dongiaceae bacterium]|nr:triacylglycerol lipase [Dongiaceae bacterium]